MNSKDMDTSLPKIIMSYFTCCLFILHVGGDNLIHPLQPHRCLDEERSALWKFKQGLNIKRYGDPTPYHKTDSWKAGGDCCSGWEGVECDQVTNHVISLDLHGVIELDLNSNVRESYIYGSISGNSTLFQLFHLQNLNLSHNDLDGQIPSSIFRLSNLSSLDLSSNHLDLQRPGLKDLIDNLTSLEHLHLDGVNMMGTRLPDSLSNYRLKSLTLSSCELTGELSSGIFHLPKLRILDLSENVGLTGHFPEFNANCSLEKVRVYYCKLSGGLTSLGRLVNLTYLDISSNDFLGLNSSSFTWLSNLTKLTHLDLSSLNINGEITPQIAHLTALNYLGLSGNDLRGQVSQAWLSNLTQLASLDLSNNQLTGQIPSSLSTLTKLVTLSLNNNRLTGSIPSLINLTSLEHIDLSFNRLEGAIPNHLSRLSSLRYLDLYSNNLNGSVELDMFHKLQHLSTLILSLSNLSLLVNEGPNSMVPDKYEYIGLGSCNLSEFPVFLLNQSNLRWLDLSGNNIHGMVPTWIWNLSSRIDFLNISHNSLTTIEDHPVMLPSSTLVTSDISFNMLQGSLPVPSPSTHFYLASNNNWSGHLSPLLCNLTDLSVLDVSNCNISGTIPQCLGTQGASLLVLDLQNNKLHGTIPQFDGDFKAIALSKNSLEGKVPRSLVNCTWLQFIDFGNNQIDDTFPSWLGVLPELKVLMLPSNRFHGEIQDPEVDSQFAQLQIIDLSCNGFSGKLPSKYFQSWKFMESLDAGKTMEYMGIALMASVYYYNNEIGNYEYSMKINNKGMERVYSKIHNLFIGVDFSHNQFEGEIPASIAKLKGLHMLNLSHNNLIGTIPPWLGDLHQLESLDLSHNKLSGKVPQEVTQQSSLSVFNVSYNDLSGIVPHGGQSDTFDNSSYIGNPGLLAYHPTQPPTLTSKTGGEEEEDYDDGPVFDKIEWMVILMGCGSGLIVGVVLGNELVVRKPLWFMKLLGKWL